MRQRRLKNEINVVPYIDVMLVLLVIFMVATPMMTTGSVNLPESGTAPGKPDKYLKVEVKPDGRLSVFDTGGKETKVGSLREMRGVLEQLKGRRPANVVIVAQAAKMARTIWAVTARQQDYQRGYQSIRRQAA